MNPRNYIKIVTLTTAALLTMTIFNTGVLAQNQDKRTILPLDPKEGHFLYTPWHSKTTYLINETGVVNHTWQGDYYPLYDAYVDYNGSVYLTIQSGQGGVQVIAYNGTTLWNYHYTRDAGYATHDLSILPNGDFLLIMQDVKSAAQAIQKGRDPSTIWFGNFNPNFIIQVHQTGPTSGDIVWEWHIWDHMIQDFDATKDNYGNVSQHPELADINCDYWWNVGWPYMNSIDYNPQNDQILLSAHNCDEIWIIDHSTTTEEAASHTGGTYGHGGDLLYRWGNPQAYNRGTAADEKLYLQHQVCWVKPGLPHAGNILIFSNGNNRPGGYLSSCDEFTPAINNDTGEYYEPPSGEPYGPANLTWQFMLPQNLFSDGFGGAQRMLNGDTFITSGWTGTFIRVTPDKQIIFTLDAGDQVYRTQYIPPYSYEPQQPKLYVIGRLTWNDVKPGETVNGTFQIQNTGGANTKLNWTVNTSALTWGTWTVTPQSGVNLTPGDGPLTINVTCVAPSKKNTQFRGSLKVQDVNNASDTSNVPIVLTTPYTPPHLFPRFRLWIDSFFERIQERFQN
jgi:hypothetical protein